MVVYIDGYGVPVFWPNGLVDFDEMDDTTSTKMGAVNHGVCYDDTKAYWRKHNTKPSKAHK